MKPPPVHALTPRERQVAAAVTRGLSNRKIGDELGISAETVKRHLASIYTKLHVPGRVALAVLVLQDVGGVLDGARVHLGGAHGVDEGEPKARPYNQEALCLPQVPIRSTSGYSPALVHPR